MEFSRIAFAKKDGVVQITLNRPDRRNALSPRMAEELTQALRGIEGDRAVRLVVLRGADGHFCSGGDLAPDDMPEDANPDLAPASPAAAVLDLMNRIYGDAIRTLHGFPKPVIALVEGIAAGAGANLAFACDLVYAAQSARFSEIFVKRGISLDCGGSWLLPRLIGLQKAKELAFFGDFISADEAHNAGLVTQVYEDGSFESSAAERIATLTTRAPVALTQIKQSLHRSMELGLSEALEIEAASQAALTATEDAAEGMRAFIEKREPHFRGR